MKYLLFVVFLVASILTAGCVGGNQNSVVSPSQTSIISSEPIIGIWQWTTSDGSKLYSFNFFSDGRYSFSDSSDPNTQPGTWSKVRENEYLITYTSGKTQAVLLNPATETFTMPEFSQVLAYRQGAKMPTPTPTIAPAQDPIIGVWTFDLGQHGIDETSFKIKYKFNADGTYLEGGYVDSQNFRTDYGTWVAQGDNLYLLHNMDVNKDTRMRYYPVNKTLKYAD